MATLLEYQTQMADALLRGDLSTTCSLFAGSNDRRYLGLRVYANNRMHALVSALRDTFPAVRAFVGEGGFTAIGVDYTRNNPMARGDLLMWYGAAFPTYLQGLDIAGAARLADLARLEYAWLEAYHAPEAHPLPPAALAALTEEQLVRARLRFHPSVRLLRSDHAIDCIWERYRHPNAHETGPQPHGPAFLAVLRPAAEVIIMRISARTFAALVRLLDGALFGEATGRLIPSDHVDELQALIAAGLFTKLETQT